MIGLVAATLLVAWVVPEAEAVVRRGCRTVENSHTCLQYIGDTEEPDLCYGAEKVTDTLYGLDLSGAAICTMYGRVICDPGEGDEICSEGDETAPLDVSTFSSSSTFDLTNAEAINETFLSKTEGQAVCDYYYPDGSIEYPTDFRNFTPYRFMAHTVYKIETAGEYFTNIGEGVTTYELIQSCVLPAAGGDEYTCTTIWDSVSGPGDPPHLPCCGAQFTATVVTDPEDGGVVTSESGDGINCGAGNNDCSVTFGSGLPGDDGCPEGSSLDVVLEEEPTQDPYGTWYEFSGWDGGGCSGTDPSCTTSAEENPTVTASFDPLWYTLTVVVNGDGEKDRVWIKTPRSDFDEPAEFYCYGTCYKRVEPGKKITIKRKGGTFGEWENACSGVPNSEDTCTITMDGNKTAVSNFIN
jgi:hypothetical protein